MSDEPRTVIKETLCVDCAYYRLRHSGIRHVCVNTNPLNYVTGKLEADCEKINTGDCRYYFDRKTT